ncbi:MAG: 2-hydroxycarboxylate transporter family protein [Thermoguttaceae bacterium]|jgi:Na+/citrate or Na+/malate symporter|nr:2-hydroxycarboxylate transporter family protein [Thermoguttaceae bacterium]
MEGRVISGLPLPLFLVLSAVTVSAVYLGVLPEGMAGAVPLLMILGAVLNELGNRLPIVKDYFGGGPIVIIFGSAALCHFQTIPTAARDIGASFMKGGGFLDFYIAALITGSILGMSRTILIRAAARYLPAIAGGLVAAFGLAGLTGALTGYGAKRAILYIAIPIMGGGMGAGAVPLSEIFGETLNEEPGRILSIMVPALALGNALSIVMAGLLDKLGRLKPSLSGDGRLLRDACGELREPERTDMPVDVETLGHGMLLAASFFVLGSVLARFIAIHPYALMILSVAAVKVFGWMPERYEIAAYQFFRFILVNLTPALLAGIGLAYTELNDIIGALSVNYLLLVSVTVIGASLGAGVTGRLVGFYPIESAISAALCMSNMGGTGDVAVLSAAKRMELMPFAQISSRLGGAFIILLATALLRLFM